MAPSSASFHKMNRLRTLSAAIVLGAASLFSSSCGDSTAPASRAVAPSAILALPSGLGGGVGTVVDTTVNALQYAVPLLGDISSDATIGVDGGTILIPQTGFRLDIPKNALSGPTMITVTAVQGSTVAYEFQPAGLTLNKRLIVTQDLSVSSIASNLLGKSFEGAYFTSRDDIHSDGTALVHELEPTVSDLTSLTVKFSIGHFSGYLVGVD